VIPPPHVTKYTLGEYKPPIYAVCATDRQQDGWWLEFTAAAADYQAGLRAGQEKREYTVYAIDTDYTWKVRRRFGGGTGLRGSMVGPNIPREKVIL